LLKKLATLLETEYGVQVLVISHDLSASDAPDKIFELLRAKKIEVNYLVNNAGFAVFGRFAETNWEEEAEMLTLQVMNYSRLIKLFLPSMIEQRSGHILNIGSTGSFVPGPYCAAYCAAKSYVLSLSEALYAELKGTGVKVTAVCPGGTKTAFGGGLYQDRSKRGMAKVMEARTVAEQAYSAMIKGKRLCIPGLVNRFQVFMLRFLPRKIIINVAEKTMSGYRDLSA